jgi:transposase
MGRNFVMAERDQLFLLPPDARQWLPERHLAWAVLEQAGQMDLGPFLAWYRADGQGRPAYHPQLMVSLIMYCYCKGIRSSRAVEMATYDDVGARVLAGNLHPDHATVARFVSRHEQAVKGLLWPGRSYHGHHRSGCAGQHAQHHHPGHQRRLH